MPSLRSFILFALTACIAACKTSDLQTSNDDGVNAVQFQDLVVPDGMTLYERFHESHSREEANWRFAHYIYTGQPKIDEVAGHLLLRMPQHSWTMVSDERPDESTRRLKFSRGRYTADYCITRQHGVTEMVIDYTTKIESS